MFRAGIIAGLATLLIASAPIPVQKPLAEHSNQESIQHPGESHQGSRPGNRGTEETPLVVKLARTKEGDTQAAEDAAYKAEDTRNNTLLMVFNGLLFLVAALEFVWIVRQERWMRESVKAANQGVAAAQKSADIAAIQTKLTRELFFASNPPRIVLRNVSLLQDGDGSRILYSLVNSGGTQAKIIESRIIGEWCKRADAIRNVLSTGYNDIGELTLAQGEVVENLEYVIPPFLGLFWALLDTPGVTEAGVIYFAGSLLYEDPSGHRRRAFFRRAFDPKSGGFCRTDDPDHEYSN
jgi:hypothetical protein